jgi:hypothetical protein
VGDPKKMVNKLDGHVFVKGVVGCQFATDLEHVLAG